MKNFFYIIIFIIAFQDTLIGQISDSLGSSIPLKNSEYTGYQINESETIFFKKPKPLQHFVSAPGDLYQYAKNSFRLNQLKQIGWMVGVTTVLVMADQDIIDGAQDFGKAIGVKGNNKIKSVAKVFGFPIQMPTDFSSSLYFIGDGWTHTSITSSFLLYGLVDRDNRALQTASQLAQGLITVTFTTQLLKHITGRQSPYRSTERGGRWDLFPNQVTYHKNVPAYDAFPSGHLASAMMMVTVISENYKEYKFIKPLGYSLMTILSFQMLNNGVHWASDYPLAIAIGYSLGKLATSRGRIVVTKHEMANTSPMNLELSIGLVSRSALGISAIIHL
ncbi:MAG: phosphatase PAP2 family protein [Calditrichaeota bacterium]|nr:MAG: phosphatase PAP2 family protein [Calditrichota bacterium]MBL1205823.1 phosphatase PAP2 family protein [Calditrichota bacterium]NOG45650.1 phosphatase PAP2 family protein [Calditrichota bacterium]